MADLSKLAGNPTPEGIREAVDPNVTRCVIRTPPADTTDELTVIRPFFSDDHIYEVRLWQSRGQTLPAEGDEGLLAFTEQGEPWLAAWWPAGGDVPPEGGGHLIQDEGSPLAERGKLNFEGGGVSVADDSGNDATVVTISAPEVSQAELDAEIAARIADVNAEEAARIAADATKQDALGFTPENVANKDTDVALAANSDVKYASQKAVKAYIDGLLAASDAVVYKAAIDCSANPNYPAADAGHLYRVSVAGKIGGGSGPNVEVGDTLLCKSDGSAAGTHAAVGANWNIIQANIDGAVVGPSSAVDSDFAQFDGTTGKLIKDGGLARDTDAGLTANSDLKIPSQKAVKGYVDTASGLLIPKSLVDAKGDLLVGTADNTVARKAVGADHKVLRALASDGSGVSWEDDVRRGTVFPSSPGDGDVFSLTLAGSEGLYQYNGASSQWIFQGSGKAVPVFSAWHSASQNYTTAHAAQKLLFDTEHFDPGGLFASSRFTTNRAGYYRLSAQITRQGTQAGAAGNYHQLYVYRNGSVYKQITLSHSGGTTYGIGVGGSAVVYSDGDDYFEIYMFSSVTGNVDAGSAATWFDGEFISNDYAGGVVTPKARVKNAGTFSVPYNVSTAVTWDTEVYDDGGLHSGSGSRLTAPVAGKYHVTGGASWASDATGHREIFIKKNGATNYAGEGRAAGSVGDHIQSISADVDLAAGDYVELFAYQNRTPGTALTIDATFSHFEMHLIPEPAGVIVPEGWTDVASFSNSWAVHASAPSSYFAPGYRKDPFGTVFLKGLMAGGTSGLVAFTLPARYRPSKRLLIPRQSYNGSAWVDGELDVLADGSVVPYGGNNFFALDNVSFKAEQ